MYQNNSEQNLLKNIIIKQLQSYILHFTFLNNSVD